MRCKPSVAGMDTTLATGTPWGNAADGLWAPFSKPAIARCGRGVLDGVGRCSTALVRSVRLLLVVVARVMISLPLLASSSISFLSLRLRPWLWLRPYSSSSSPDQEETLL